MIDLENGVFLEQVEDLSVRKRWPDVRDMLTLLEPADIAAVLAELPEDRLPLIYRLLPKELAAEVFVEMEAEEQELLIRSFSDTELREVLEELYVDDTVDLIEDMPANLVSRILRNTNSSARSQINQLLNYPKDSAGSLMTTDSPPHGPGDPPQRQRDSQLSGGFRRVHHDHGVRGSEAGYDGLRCPQAHPPHGRG